jgi:hypothetical protein
MAYLSYEQVAVSNAVKDVDDLTVPAEATHAELQADTNAIRYTMDGATAPTTSSGMLLLTTSDPKLFLIEDIKNIKVIRNGASDGNLNVHYCAGRDV